MILLLFLFLKGGAHHRETRERSNTSEEKAKWGMWIFKCGKRKGLCFDYSDVG
jgi:hypothetical protein